MRNTQRRILWVLILGLMFPTTMWSQEGDGNVALKPAKEIREKRIKGEKPNQLDIIKVDLLQLGINEARLWYEMQTGKHASLEFGVGAIYKNGFWYDRGERPMLANGFGLYFAFRKYMDKKRYFSEPKMRSYFSPLLFYRFSTYENEWLSFVTDTPNLYDCSLQSEKIHQAAAVVRFGWQTAMGRVAIDFYSGMGFKFIPSIRTTHVFTPLTAVCAVNSTTVALGTSEKFYGTNVIFNAGVKLGLRRNNLERHYEGDAPAPEADPENPPQF